MLASRLMRSGLGNDASLSVLGIEKGEKRQRGRLAMSRMRGSLFAAKPQILFRSSGGSLGKMVNIVSVVASVAIVGQGFSNVVRCERYVRIVGVVEEVQERLGNLL